MQLSLLFFALFAVIPCVQWAEIIVPKEVATQTPIQQQYYHLLTAFRATLGGSEKTHDKPASTEKERNTFGSLSLTEETQMEMALEHMAHLDTPNYSTKGLAFFSPETWPNLHLIGQEGSVLNGIAPNMKTIFGKLFLGRKITAPSMNPSTIRNSQKVIEQMCAQREDTAKIVGICKKIGDSQEQLLGLTSLEHPIFQKDLRLYLHEFFLRGIAPKSRRWNNISKTIGDFWYLLGPAILSAGLVSSAKAYWKRTGGAPEQGGARDFARKLFTQPLYNQAQRAGRYPLEANWGKDFRLTALGVLGVSTYLGGVQIPGIVQWLNARFKAASYFYDQLLPLRNFFVGVKELKENLTRFPTLSRLAQEIDSEVKIDTPEMKKLRSILLGKAFKNKFMGVFVLGGDILLAIDLLKHCRHEVLKGIGLLGALDTYSSLSTWFTQFKNDSVRPLCLAQFIQGRDRPFLDIKDFWHPLVRQQPVLNSIKLGDGNPQNAIVTGLFESGKSTVLQCIALNIICAQSIGICLARSYSATPYASINVYANIKDDIANNRSLFKAEVYHAGKLLESIEHLPAGHFSASLIDSTFTGTEAGAGQATSYAITRYLGKLRNSITVHGTNFLSLSILAEQMPDLFMTLMLPSAFNGNIIQTYGLTPGTQDPQLSTAIFREEKFPESMIAEIERQLRAIGARA